MFFKFSQKIKFSIISKYIYNEKALSCALKIERIASQNNCNNDILKIITTYHINIINKNNQPTLLSQHEHFKIKKINYLNVTEKLDLSVF